MNEDQQEILYFLFVRLYSTTRLAEMRHRQTETSASSGKTSAPSSKSGCMTI